MHDFSVKFTIGMILLATNQAVGWGGIIYFAYLAKKTGKKIYIAAGTVIYIVSWGMLALGMMLAGPEGLALIKKLFAVYRWQSIGAILFIAVVAVYFKFLRPKKISNEDQTIPS